MGSKEPNPDSGTDGTEPGPYESKEPGPYESKEPGPGRNSKEPNPDSGTDGTEPGPYESKEPGPYESKEPGPGEDKCYCKSQCGCDEEGAIRGEIEYGYKRTKGRPTAH